MDKRFVAVLIFVFFVVTLASLALYRPVFDTRRLSHP
jgi:hypothetical protein